MIKNKLVSEGYNLYTVASCGYLLGFRVYRGKGGYDNCAAPHRRQPLPSVVWHSPHAELRQSIHFSRSLP